MLRWKNGAAAQGTWFRLQNKGAQHRGMWSACTSTRAATPYSKLNPLAFFLGNLFLGNLLGFVRSLLHHTAPAGLRGAQGAMSALSSLLAGLLLRLGLGERSRRLGDLQHRVRVRETSRQGAGGRAAR